MSEKKDSVFQVSITEIAFTLILLLVLLLGIKLMHNADELNQQHETIVRQEQKLIEMKEALTRITQYGGICRPDEDDPVDPMMPCNKCVSVIGKISKDDAAKDIDIGRKVVEQWNAHKKDGQDFKQFANDLLNTASLIAQGERPAFEGELADRIKALTAEKKSLEQQMQALEEQLADSKTLESNLQTCLASNAFYKRRAGLDNPPCWLTKNNKPGYIFNVTLLPDDKLIVERGWPEEFASKAAELAPVQELQDVFGKEIPVSQFLPVVQKMRQIGDQTKPEACRHFVRLRNTIPDRPTADRTRIQIEQGFYKFEVQ